MVQTLGLSPVAAMRYAGREAHVWTRLWRGTVFSGLVGPLLFLGAMGLGVGGMVDEHTGTVSGLKYLSFVAPGLLVASASERTAMSCLWQVMGGHKWMGTFRAAVATPLRPGDVYAGYLMWMAALVGMNAVPFLAIAALLGGVPSLWGVLAIPAAVLCATAFAAPLAAFACSQDDEVYFSAVHRLIILPLFLFSGTFFPLSELPPGLRPIAWLTPMWHGVELARSATTGTLDLLPALGHVAFLLAVIAAGMVWGVRSFSQRLTP